MKHSLKERVKGSLVRPLGFRVATGLSPTFKIPLIESVSSVPSGLVSTFARNSTATYIEDGLVKTAGIGVIRFQNGRYLCEPAATNMLSYSELLTNVYWGGTGLSIAADAPTGMFKLTNTLTGSCHTKSGSLSFTSGIYYTQSAELMKGNTDFVSMTFASSVSNLLPYAIFNLSAGIVTKAQNCTATMYPLASGAYRCTITVVATATVSILGGVITPCRENSLRAEGVVGDYIYANKIQTETGTQATSYIPTTSTAVTRAADSLHYNVGDVITQGQGSLYCEFTSSGVGIIRYLIYMSDNTFNNLIYMRVGTDGKLSARGKIAGTESLTITSPNVLPSQLNKAVVVYQTNNVKLYINGVYIGADVTFTVPITLSKLSVGCLHTGTEQANGEVGGVRYYKEVLTEAEAIKLTTL